MSKIDELIKEKCPNGVERKPLREIAKIKRGERITKKDITDDGEYPVMSGGVKPMGRYKDKNRDANTITISSYGAAGFVNYVEEGFWANDVCLSVYPDEKILINRYLYFALKAQQQYIYDNTTKAIPDHIPTKFLEDLQIPLPPLEIQQEIVGILNSFTELEAELEAELTKRKQQYEYYRDHLLSFENIAGEGGQVEWLTLGDVCKLVTGATPSRTNHSYWDGGTIPWMNSGEVNLRRVFKTEEKITEDGYNHASTTIVPKHSIVMALAGQGKTRGRVAITEIELCTNQSLCSIICGEKINYKYLFHYLDSKYENLRSISNGDGTRGGLSLRILSPYKIPVPTLDVQEKIVYVLDNFDAVCNDLNIGLPAEIEARQKQYEYYRDRLLSFDAVIGDGTEREREREE